jgi:hypothetical protein
VTTEAFPAPETYFQVGIPGVPYSAIRAPLGTNVDEMNQWAEWVAACAQIISARFAEAFPAQPQDVPIRQVSVRPAGSPTTPMRKPEIVASTGAFCPEHPGVEVVPSKAQYARFEEDENGQQVQANFFCPGKENGTGKNHNLWRRQLVWAE